MDPGFSKQALSFTFCLIAVFLLTSGIANGGQRLKIVIDASKDGGLWWFPQAGSFDSTLAHQGKQFADSLRRSGAEVIELPRGDVITLAKLNEADVVIRVPAFFRYTPEEATAYRGSVAGGTRLLLIGGGYPMPWPRASESVSKTETAFHPSAAGSGIRLLKMWVRRRRCHGRELSARRPRRYHWRGLVEPARNRCLAICLTATVTLSSLVNY